jgi:hypothetical protein
VVSVPLRLFDALMSPLLVCSGTSGSQINMSGV